MKRALPRDWKVGLLVGVPLALFLVARERASWRPVKVAGLPYGETIAFSADERFVANGGESGLVSVRDLSSGEEVKHNSVAGLVECMAFSPDGTKLAVAWMDAWRDNQAEKPRHMGVSVWEFGGKDREFRVSLRKSGYDVPTQVRFSPDGRTMWLASANNLRSWDLASGRLTYQLRDASRLERKRRYFSALSPDCHSYMLYATDWYSVWDVRTQRQLVQARLPYAYEDSMEVSDDGALSFYNDGGVHSPLPMDALGRFCVISARDGQMRYRLVSRPAFVGDTVVTAAGNQFEVHNARTGSVLYRLSAVPGTHPLSCASRNWLYSLGDDGDVYRQRFR